jgi:hypothetical protein
VIDKKKLIEDIRKCDRFVVEFGEEKTLFDMVLLDDVNSTINRQPKTDWIPCEERLPSEYGQYLYTDKNGEVHEGCYSPPNIGMINCWSTCEAFGFVRLSDDDVIAWQPLPQAYKKEGAE